jgi:hypothetical protein
MFGEFGGKFYLPTRSRSAGLVRLVRHVTSGGDRWVTLCVTCRASPSSDRFREPRQARKTDVLGSTRNIARSCALSTFALLARRGIGTRELRAPFLLQS